MQKIAFGGGCHWCTEAIFDSLKGVQKVEQGWINSSEAVIVHFDESQISMDILIEIHLFIHSSTSDHSLREKYRSAIYSFTDSQESEAQHILHVKQKLFEKPLITKVYPFEDFRLNEEKYLNYYKKNVDKPFCQTYIEPKLKILLENKEVPNLPREKVSFRIK